MNSWRGGPINFASRTSSESSERPGCSNSRSGDLLPPSPPAEKVTARHDQTGQASTDTGRTHDDVSIC
jgi:hypothetical protein